jgi:molybdopterin converting factor small subunit
MLISIRAGGDLKNLLKPNIDQYTMQIQVPEGVTIREILGIIGIKIELIALTHTKGKIQRLDYVPEDGDVITIQPPVSGG